MKINNVTIGSDPELFIINLDTDRVVSSIGLIPGRKGDPYRDKDMPTGFGLEVDNILAEYNIPPCKKIVEFVNAHNFMKDYIRRFVKKVNPNYDIKCTASCIVDEDQLQSDEAKLFGCSVDFNAYTRQSNPRPEGDKTNLRSAGFHIHVGYDNPSKEVSLDLVKHLDVTLGIPSVLIDEDSRRRLLYGKAGCFRLTSYGVEYRVLSGAFLANDFLISFMWENTMKAVCNLNNGLDLPDPITVQRIINEGDKNLAKNFITKNKQFYR
jgi:hypothetical protein